jgi:hypothetical protein
MKSCRARHGLQRPRARARDHHPREKHERSLEVGTEPSRRSTSSTPLATPTSAARSSARFSWPTARFFSSMPPRARSRRPASSSASASSSAFRSSSSSTRSTAPTRARTRSRRGLRSLLRSRRVRDAQTRVSGPLRDRHATASRNGHARRSVDDARAAVRDDPRQDPAGAGRSRRAAADPREQRRPRRLRGPTRHRANRFRDRAGEPAGGRRQGRTHAQIDGQGPVDVRRAQADARARGRRARSSRSPGSKTSTSATRSSTWHPVGRVALSRASSSSSRPSRCGSASTRRRSPARASRPSF